MGIEFGKAAALFDRGKAAVKLADMRHSLDLFAQVGGMWRCFEWNVFGNWRSNA